MLGKTAGAVMWMFRYLERSENMARLIEAGMRIALTHSDRTDDGWRSLIETVGTGPAYEALHGRDFNARDVCDYLLRERQNNGSVLQMLEDARQNGRLARTAITREVWEALNECYLASREALAHPLSSAELPNVLAMIRQHSAQVRGALHGTMLRNDVFNFARLGTFVERADNTARILDVKYFVLLPSAAWVGSSLDNVQWENVLRSLSAQRAYRWLNPGESGPRDIASFLILDMRFPRSLAYCMRKILSDLGHLREDYGDDKPCHALAEELFGQIAALSIDDIFEQGLHDFVQQFLKDNYRLAGMIGQDYLFTAEDMAA